MLNHPITTELFAEERQADLLREARQARLSLHLPRAAADGLDSPAWTLVDLVAVAVLAIFVLLAL
jgi:hypothetical protein